jgi:hypothetical protein
MAILGKFKIYIIMFFAFAMFAGVLYWYYQDTQAAMRQYAENNARLETALVNQKAATDSLIRDIRRIQTTLSELNNEFTKSRQRVADIELLFSQGTDGRILDFGDRAIEQPQVIEEALNKGTTEMFRCFEILSGKNSGDVDVQTQYINCVNANTNRVQ